MPAADMLRSCRRLVQERLPDSRRGLRRDDAALYLAHTFHGAPLRRLAAAEGRSPSTILRAVRRVELRRDDPLLDALVCELEDAASSPGAPAPLAKEIALTQPCQTSPIPRLAELGETPAPVHASGHASGPARLARRPRPAPSETEGRREEKEARRILRRLSEPRAFLALARGAEVACVFRKADGALVTLARTPLDMARAFAARDWIACAHQGPNMARYEITSAGRAWLKRTLSEDGDARRRAVETPDGACAAPGLAEAPGPFARQHQLPGERWVEEPGRRTRLKVNVGETPLGWLARRKGADGRSFLAAEEVAAGERLREDFERAQLGPRVAQDWRSFLTSGTQGGGSGGRSPSEGPAAAREKVARALEAVGPGLNDAVLRACCFLEGLEATERRMGWSARSGKVVLKIALSRLAVHYGFDAGRDRRGDLPDARREDGAAA